MKKIPYFKDILVHIMISNLEKFVGEKNFNTFINKKCKMSVKIEAKSSFISELYNVNASLLLISSLTKRCPYV